MTDAALEDAVPRLADRGGVELSRINRSRFRAGRGPLELVGVRAVQEDFHKPTASQVGARWGAVVDMKSSRSSEGRGHVTRYLGTLPSPT